MCTWKRSNDSFCSVWSIFNSTSASILGRGLLCWPLSAAQKAFAKIIVVFKCQASRLPEKKWDTTALMHLHVWVCMLRVTVTKHEARYFKYVYYSDSSHTCCFSQHGVATTLKKIQNKYKKGLKGLHSNTKTNSNGLHFYIRIHSNISNGLILARRLWVRCEATSSPT